MSEVKYYKTSDIAKQFGVNLATVRSWIKVGRLKSVNPSGQHRISEEDLQLFINQSNTKRGFNTHDPS